MFFMFTGLIESICRVKSVSKSSSAMLLTIDLGELADGTKTGDSITINGACLTATGLDGRLARFDVSPETLAKSNLGRLKPTSMVNAERAIKADGRFGGHFVTGHIDGTAVIKAIEKAGQFAEIKLEADRELLNQMVLKGSVAVDGISLTIADMNEVGFSVTIIPETLKKTTLGKAKVGDVVNIENDIIVKTVIKELKKIVPQKEKLTIEKLAELGF
jgi:riboflavin synthase